MEETYQILLGLRERYEAHHKLRYTDEALDAAAKFSSQYISDRFLPDKAYLLSRPCLLISSCDQWRLLISCRRHAEDEQKALALIMSSRPSAECNRT